MAQRCVGSDDFDDSPRRCRWRNSAVNAQGAVAAIEQRVKSIPYGARFTDIVQIDNLIDLARHLGQGQKTRCPRFAKGNGLGAGRQKHLVLNVARHFHTVAGGQNLAHRADRIEA